MNMKALLSLNILFIAYGESYGACGVEARESFDELSYGMTPEMKKLLGKILELKRAEDSERAEIFHRMEESMSPEEVEMIRIMFLNAERKFKAAS